MGRVSSGRAIALTAHASADYIERSRTAGFDAHLPKPVSIEQLTETVLALVKGPDVKVDDNREVERG